ncbi:MAG: histidine kinase internal region [Candidatus Solibacter sp.]|nr:histidine kinase internal region [Candidatus Solibacter sp.]
MNALHVTVSNSASFAGSLIGFTTGLLITTLLLILTLRASKLPGTPFANIVFALCGICWSAGGLIHTGLLAAGQPLQSFAMLASQALQYTGAAAFPIPILAIWRPFAVSARQRRAARVLEIASWISAVAIAALLWLAPFSFSSLWHLTAYNAAIFVVLGAAVSLRRDSTLRGVYGPSLAIVTAILGAALAGALARQKGGFFGIGFSFIGSHLILIALVLAFLLFARFRYADVFIRYGIRILLAGFWATLLSFTAQSAAVMHVARQASAPAAMHVFIVILLANFFLLSFTYVDDRLTSAASRWLFREPDYRTALREFAVTLRELHDAAHVGKALEATAGKLLELSGSRWLALDDATTISFPTALLEGEIVELDYPDPLRGVLPLANVEVLVPVAPAGRVTHVLLIAPGAGRPALVMQDLNYLRAAAAQAGNRLDALRRERDAAERESREAVLQQQVTEAELRALRAQINPHFLFNSLNTIADLVVRDAARAEAMTLRLAGVFRHVLANSSRPLTSIRDEIEFLRTYLYIEEVRFGDRLRVQIEMAPEIAGEEIPSLILQPLVENALKHGLAPRPGPGRLWISARAENSEIYLRVEDDGVGLGAGRSGLGLTNVAERLATLYQDRASVTLEPREGGGARAAIRIPRSRL